MVEVTTPDGKRLTPINVLLMATSRVLNTNALEVANTGVELNQRGYIDTDKYPQANVPSIWPRAMSWSPTC